jgi:hypothetical protein
MAKNHIFSNKYTFFEKDKNADQKIGFVYFLGSFIFLPVPKQVQKMEFISATVICSEGDRVCGGVGLL